jgi:hypothetical protein
MYQERRFLRLCWHTKIMRRQQQRRGTVGENRHWQEEIVVHWGLFRKSHNYSSTGDSRTEYILILKTQFTQKLSDVNFTNSTPTVGLQLLNLWLLEVILRYVNDGVTTIPGHQTTGNEHMICSHEWSFALFLTSEEFTFGEHPRQPTIRNACSKKWNKGEVLWWYTQQYRGAVFCWPYYHPSWPNYCKGVHGQVG